MGCSGYFVWMFDFFINSAALFVECGGLRGVKSHTVLTLKRINVAFARIFQLKFVVGSLMQIFYKLNEIINRHDCKKCKY